jgi:hypothetical protein
MQTPKELPQKVVLQTWYHQNRITNIVQNNFSFGNRLSLNEEAEIADSVLLSPKNNS